MVRTVDYELRRKAILAATINRYIGTGSPVASEDVAKDFGLSSATVRNIFSELENAGYLTHPYTSGGRFPTNKGYRYYVDVLIQQMDLLSEEKLRIEREYKREIGRLEDILEKTSELIASITHYAGITIFPELQDRFFYRGISQVLNHPEFQTLESIRFLVKALEEKQRLLEIINRGFEDKVKVYIGEELECPDINGCALVVSSYRIKNKPAGKIAVLGPVRMEYKHTISAVEYISEALSEVLSDF
ncbi:MAG: hypothetical protein PHN57_06760 [Candidatus Omnitrophica bacterium]|nr:hypothetical protein [Candidatus Omnitrophota bacterium]